VQSFFFIRQDGRNVKVDFHNILYIEARKNYTRLVMADRSAMVLITLKQWERILPSQLFCRVHRGYIVSIERILSFDNKSVYLPGMNVAIGDQYRNALPMAVTIVASEVPRKEVLSGLAIEAY
jgi:DNA-binding LytR/AlgR family response regulator